jgi:hypothetical protein
MNDRIDPQDTLLVALAELPALDLAPERTERLEARLLQAFHLRSQGKTPWLLQLETGLVALGGVVWIAWAFGAVGALTG